MTVIGSKNVHTSKERKEEINEKSQNGTKFIAHHKESVNLKEPLE